jgi:hypothetical protein
MFAAFRTQMLTLVAAFVATAGFADVAKAEWLTIRNDTNRVIVVQETVMQNGQMKRLKPVRLLPGESVRQCESTPGTKTYEVYDAQNPGQPLWMGNVKVTDANQTFSVRMDGPNVVMREVPMAGIAAKKP